MFTDPQSVTINAVAQTLPRTGLSTTVGTFTKDDGNVELVIGKAVGKRIRRTVRLNFRKIAPDAFQSDMNTSYSMSCYLVVDVPPVGFTVAEQKYVVDALVAYLTASTGARVTQLLGGEL